MLIVILILGVAAGALIVFGVAGGGAKKSVVAKPATTTTIPTPATRPSGVAPSTTTTARVVPTTTATTKAPVGVMFKVTGAGSATAASVTIIEGAQEQHHPGAALPFTATLPDNYPTYGLTAQSASTSTSGSISCEIDQPGHAPVINTSSGPYALVNCIGASG